MMLLRPVDSSGDILPVLSVSQMLTGAEAVTALVRDRLNLNAGEWWENPSHGCAVLSMLREGRLSEADKASLTSYLTSYILSTPGVQSVDHVSAAVSGRQFSYSCQVLSGKESGNVAFAVSL